MKKYFAIYSTQSGMYLCSYKHDSWTFLHEQSEMFMTNMLLIYREIDDSCKFKTLEDATDVAKRILKKKKILLSIRELEEEEIVTTIASTGEVIKRATIINVIDEYEIADTYIEDSIKEIVKSSLKSATDEEIVDLTGKIKDFFDDN